MERKYVREFAGRGVVVGACAVAPGLGSGVASTGEVVSSLQVRSLFALSIAEVHGVSDGEDGRLRMLIGVALYVIGSAAIPRVAARTGPYWGRRAVAKVPVARLREINGLLGPNFVTKHGTKQGIVVLGQVAPLGFGAVMGGSATAALAALHVWTARRAFGPPPASWPSPTLTAQIASEDSLG
ncbi:hypothetical protein [Streptomyces canus]|uniref:hypothetical protein n=1 Tax=Streptomyces canus TaxID=58343 RepID=UPI0032568AC4